MVPSTPAVFVYHRRDNMRHLETRVRRDSTWAQGQVPAWTEYS